MPDTARPKAGPDAPITAFDTMSAEFATRRFGFHDPTENPAGYLDTTGCEWAWSATLGKWERRTRPTHGAAAATPPMPDIIAAIEAVIDVVEPGGQLERQLLAVRARLQREAETDYELGTVLVDRLAARHDLTGIEIGSPNPSDLTTIGRIARECVDAACLPQKATRDVRPA